MGAKKLRGGWRKERGDQLVIFASWSQWFVPSVLWHYKQPATYLQRFSSKASEGSKPMGNQLPRFTSEVPANPSSTNGEPASQGSPMRNQLTRDQQHGTSYQDSPTGSQLTQVHQWGTSNQGSPGKLWLKWRQWRWWCGHTTSTLTSSRVKHARVQSTDMPSRLIWSYIWAIFLQKYPTSKWLTNSSDNL